jgi:hypothetical protein
MNINAVIDQVKKPVVIVGVVSFVIGLIVGLVVLGWGIWPVQYSPSAEYARDYLSMTIDSFVENQDKALAQSRWSTLGSAGTDALLWLKANPGVGRPTVADIDAFAAAVNIPGQVAQPVPGSTAEAGAESAATQTTGETSAGLFSLRTLLIVVGCFVVLAVVAGLAAYILLRRRGPTDDQVSSRRGAEGGLPVQQSAYEDQGAESPVAQFMTTFALGNDLYDDSFSIDSLTGEFLGECGVGISDTIGVGDPKKPTAFEVWLFDKNDIQTVTSVLMSAHAFNDSSIRQKLESKGEPVLTTPGQQIILETATLQLIARVVDMNYGQGALPANSFFDRLTLELAVWNKTK